MYNLDQIKVLEIETTNTCNASCPQCMRTNEDTLIPNQFNDDLDWARLRANVPKTFWPQLKYINFNGISGDNIAHKQIQDIVLDVCNLAPQATIRVCTNGSLRSTSWWEQFGLLLKDRNVEVIFGIDGLADTHSLYRVGTDWQKVIDNATAFIQAGGSAVWQMILFDHNLHQIESCRELAKKLNFHKFYLRSENRFPAGAKEQVVFWRGKPTHTIRYPDNLSQHVRQDDVVNEWSHSLTPLDTDSPVNCHSMNIKWMAFYADGTVWPCCWLMGWHKATHLKQYALTNYHFRKVLKIDFAQISLYNNKLEDIVASDLWVNRYPKSFTNQPNPVCKQQCSR